MLILGLNAYHGDSAAALVRDGKIVCAVEEERFRRIKHWAGLPTESIRYCLQQAGAKFTDLDCIAINQDNQASRRQRFKFLLTRPPSVEGIAKSVRNRHKRSSVITELEKSFDTPFTGKFLAVEHHKAHLASAYYCSPFNQAHAVSVDGFGDFASSAWGFGEQSRLTLEKRVYFPHSLGIFYQALTQFIGFPNYGDEYKVMGLAPYGEPLYVDKLHELLDVSDSGEFELNLRYFRHQTGKLNFNWENGYPVIESLFSTAMHELLGPPRQAGEPLEQQHRDLARSVQSVYEQTLFRLLNARYQSNPSPAIVLAGGCAQNSVANGKINRNTPFTQVYVQAAAGDAGGALGAACVAWYESGERDRADCQMPHAFLGPSFDDEYVTALLESHDAELAAAGCAVEVIDDERTLTARTASAIADGKVIGWFQGRMEWGPRALGNRSILGDPRRADMKDILNAKIKRRESFRPFAPSILREAVSDWFEVDTDVPFMMQVQQIRPEKRAEIPAVTHVDGSGRLQTVSAEQNPLYAQLITDFAQLTDVPMLLNTSFNENEPIVCKPEEALSCFLRTSMDVLVLGQHYITRHQRS